MEQKQAAVTNESVVRSSACGPEQQRFAPETTLLQSPRLLLQRLHATVGNRSTGRWLQTKLRIGPANDSYEQEADRVADRVMRMALPAAEKRAVSEPAGPVVQRECPSCGEEEGLQRKCDACGEEEELQRKRADDEETGTEIQRKESGGASAVAPPIVHEVLRSSGEPLDAATRTFMEPRFGQDFSRVRIHTDDAAARSARAVNALAYTVGSDVVFDVDRYNPGNMEGRRLLAHELTHVVQQNGERALSPAGPGTVVQRAISKELDQIEDYLSYGLFDWAITEDEAKKALDLLKTLPKFQQAAFFSSKKYAGRLRSHLPAARLPELNAVETAVADFTPPRAEIADIDSNLSYGLFDWVITDREAIESLEKLKKLPVQQLAVALAVIRYDRLMDNLPDARKPELAELSKLASQVNVKDVEPRAAARRTKGQIFGVPPAAGMTLSEFRTYTQQQADWFVEASLSGPDRDALWGLLLHAEEGPHILSGVGDLQVSDLRAVAVGDWAPLGRFCAGTHAEGHTIRIFPPLPTLADRIELGKTLRSLETSIPGPVLEVTASQAQLEKVRTDGLAPKLAAYWTDYQPHIEQTFTPAPAARGPEFDRVITFLNSLGGPGLAALAPLRGPTPDERWVRNLHRFPLPMLKKLVANLGDFTGAKRLILVLHTGHDAPAAFQNAASLFSDLVLTSPGNLVLMIEGATSLAAITARIPTITATWGQLVGGVRKISQVVIAGHGSTQTVGMAGTSAPTVSAEGNVKYTEQSLVKGEAATEALLKALLHNMDPASARILYAGCLVGATDVPAGTAAAAIPGAIAAQQSLGAHTDALAPGEGIPAGRVQAARASVALGNLTSLFDPGTGDLKATYPFDPNAFGSASDYAQTGHEPEGVLRAAVEVGAVSTATAETLLRTRLTMPAIVDDWYDIVTRLLVGLALPPVVGAGVDLKKVNELANIADTPFLVLWDQFNITPAHFKNGLNPQVFAADVYSGIAATVYYTAPVGHGTQRMRVIVDQGWLALVGAAKVPTLLAGILVAGLGANVLKRYLDKGILKPQVAALLPSVGVPTSEQLTLALAWFDLDNADADVKSFLLAQVLHPANAPAALNPALHAVAAAGGRTDRDVLDQLGFTPAAVAAPPVGGGAALPLANLALPDSAAMNRILVTGKPHLAHVVVPTASVRLEPAAIRPPFTTLASGASVNVMGSVGDYRAVDAGGRLGFVNKAEISPP